MDQDKKEYLRKRRIKRIFLGFMAVVMLVLAIAGALFR